MTIRQAANLPVNYLVPALLPISIDRILSAPTDKPYFTVYFSAQTLDYEVVMSASSRKNGFLPTGFFSRLSGKCMAWSQSTSSMQPVLTRHAAKLSFGSQVFTMYEDVKSNSILVYPRSKNPVPVHERLIKLVNEVVNECFHTLNWEVLLPFNSPELPQEHFIELNHIRGSHESQEGLWVDEIELKGKGLSEQFSEWLRPEGLLDRYDGMISYRWTDSDRVFAEKLFDCMSIRSTGALQRRVEIFLDKYRLQQGRRFDQSFLHALSVSSVVMMLVSVDGMQPFYSLQSDSPVDNVLLEWTLAIELEELGLLKCIVPVLQGYEVDGPSGPTLKAFFDPDPKPHLPEVVVQSVVKKVSEFIIGMGHSPTPTLQSRTVKQTVVRVCEYLGILTWESMDPEQPFALALNRLPQLCADKIMVHIDNAAAEEAPKTQSVKPTVKPKMTQRKSSKLMTGFKKKSQPQVEHADHNDVRTWLESIKLEMCVTPFLCQRQSRRHTRTIRVRSSLENHVGCTCSRHHSQVHRVA